MRNSSMAKPGVYICFAIWIIVLSILGMTVTCASDAPRAECPIFVDEGDDLDCQCSPPKPDMTSATITWGEHSNTSRLFVNRVSWHDNGKKFTCQMIWRGQPYTTVYTLQVAYGPVKNAIYIDGPVSFPTDGSRSLTLTCRADHVNPIPIFTWPWGEPCNDGKEKVNCTFQPDPSKHDGMDFTCRAVNPYSNTLRAVEKTFTLHLQYPPTKKPRIDGHFERQIHKSGDKLTCTVQGGKPLVSQVNFSCTNPVLQDQPDVPVENASSSSLTVDFSEPRDTGIETYCTCFAIWEPDRTLYTKNISISFAIHETNGINNKNKGDSSEGNKAVGGCSSCTGTIATAWTFGMTCAVLVAIIFLWFLRKCRRRFSKKRQGQQVVCDPVTSNPQETQRIHDGSSCVAVAVDDDAEPLLSTLNNEEKDTNGPSLSSNVELREPSQPAEDPNGSGQTYSMNGEAIQKDAQACATAIPMQNIQSPHGVEADTCISSRGSDSHHDQTTQGKAKEEQNGRSYSVSTTSLQDNDRETFCLPSSRGFARDHRRAGNLQQKSASSTPELCADK